jgi:hypothetical protein
MERNLFLLQIYNSATKFEYIIHQKLKLRKKESYNSFWQCILHKFQKIEKCINENEVHRPDHPLYSSDLAPTSFYLNVYFKEKLKDHSYLNSESLLSKIRKCLSKISKSTLKNAIRTDRKDLIRELSMKESISLMIKNFSDIYDIYWIIFKIKNLFDLNITNNIFRSKFSKMHLFTKDKKWIVLFYQE